MVEEEEERSISPALMSSASSATVIGSQSIALDASTCDAVDYCQYAYLSIWRSISIIFQYSSIEHIKAYKRKGVIFRSGIPIDMLALTVYSCQIYIFLTDQASAPARSSAALLTYQYFEYFIVPTLVLILVLSSYLSWYFLRTICVPCSTTSDHSTV